MRMCPFHERKCFCDVRQRRNTVRQLGEVHSIEPMGTPHTHWQSFLQTSIQQVATRVAKEGPFGQLWWGSPFPMQCAA